MFTFILSYPFFFVYFFSIAPVKDVAASGKNELSDAVQFTGNTTFNVDLPNGVYKVKVTLGNTGRTSVYMENQLQIVNMTGNNAVDEILIPITDGQLNIRAAAGKSGNAYTISSIEIDKVSDEAVLPSTIWLCGDSTVCNYYPLNTSTQGGWGQMLGHYVDKGWNIRNMAASGSYAQAFSTDGSFATVEKYGKAGDVFIISIGINDSKYYKGDEYKKIVTDMVKRAKAKGMEVILVKQQGRNGDAQKNPLLTSRWYAAELDQVGKEQNCQVVDLFKLWQDYCISIGASKTNSLYMDGDTLHPNRAGAEKLAELFASQFKQTPSSSGSQTTPTPTNPPASSDKLEGKFIKNLVVKDTKNAGGWKISNSTSTGGTIFGDRDYTYNSLPDVIKGAEAIMTACDSKNTDAVLAEFTAGDNIDVYILLDTRVEENGTVPSWLGDWTRTGLTAESSNDVTFMLYKKTYNSGNTVTLGTNGMSGNVINYTVFVKAKEEQIVTPTEAPTTAPTSSGQTSATLWGDANCDGNVTIADATAILQYLGNKDKYSLSAQGAINADVSEPDGITANDAIVIQQVDAEIISQKDLPLRKINDQPATGNQPNTEAQPEASANSIYYAVDMKIESGVKEDTNEGFKGTAYVNLDNMIGSNIEWTVNTAQDGNYLCTFNIANGSADNRSMKIEVNNGSDYWLQDFLTTGDWTKWEERGIVLPLKNGENKIRMTSVTTQGGPNLDYLKIELTDEPIAETYDPEANKNPGSGQQNVARTIYIAGDSTVQTYKASYAPQQGWGAYLGDNLSDMVSVSNQAIAGRSSKSFYDNGRLDTILGSIKQGDYLLIQFGINDSASGNAERYAPVSGKIPGTTGSFEYYMAKYIEGAKEKGATPILVTTVIGLKAYNKNTKKFETSYPNYCNAMKDLAKHYDVPIIDLNTLMVNHYNSIGYDAAYKYHLAGVVSGSTDMTHFSETGAKAVAKLVADELKNQGLC